MITLGSMFAGIGGLELGFESTGRFETKWQVEIDDYANQVLSKHWPSVARWKNVKTFPPRPLADWQCDVIAGGFPCQDLSFAGKGAGLAGERSGLFSEIIRVASIIKPRAIVLENVAALYARGLDVVLGEMAQIGYDAEWHCVSAASVGAPHRRDRVFIIGWNTNGKHDEAIKKVSRRTFADTGGSGATLCDTYGNCKPISTVDAKASKLQGDMADTSSKRSAARVSGTTRGSQRDAKITINGCDRLPRGTASNQWAVEPSMGRVANGVPRRVDRLRCLGNAIVPQVAKVVADRLLEIIDEQNPQPAV